MPGSSPQPKNLLVRGVNWLGDAVMTTPALLRLREGLPNSRISLLTREKLKGLWTEHPALDEVLTIREHEGPLSVGRRLRACQFDAALILPNSFRSALEIWFARIPRRVGYGSPGSRSMLLTTTVPPRPGQVLMRKKSVTEVTEASSQPPPSPFGEQVHQLHDYLHLAAQMGASPQPLPPRLHLGDHEVARARNQLLHGTAAEDAPILLGLNPGAEYGPAKRWPAQNFAAVAREVSRRLGRCAWLVFGGERDARLAEQICQLARVPMVNVAGKTDLRDLLALLSCCDVVLSNDTGPAHAAAAVGATVVIPFGSTSPELTGPGLPGRENPHLFLRNPVACAPCFRRECPLDFRCMTGIPVNTAVDAVLSSIRKPV